MFLKMFVRGGWKVWFVRSLIINIQQERVVYHWYLIWLLKKPLVVLSLCEFKSTLNFKGTVKGNLSVVHRFP